MGKITEDYESNIVHVKNCVDEKIRKDVMIQIKRNMIKRTIIKIADILIITLSVAGVIPAFLGYF